MTNVPKIESAKWFFCSSTTLATLCNTLNMLTALLEKVLTCFPKFSS